MMQQAAPRIYCIPATQAPVVAVFRRGPSNWTHLGRWDLAGQRYEPGAWLGGRIFPRRADLSPDGQYLCYFAHKPSATWEHGEAYVAISKLPWLTALHAFGTCGTWTRGYYFTEEDRSDNVPMETLPIPYRLRSIPVVQFANERQRGWIEAEDSPARDYRDAWDQHRNARMRKPQPCGTRVLCVESVGWAGGEFGVDQAVDGLNVRYSLESNGDLDLLDDLQWADWSREGHLLVATRSGRLQMRKLRGESPEILFEADLSRLEPNPTPAPIWAQNW
ncbi:MAG: hypothetical protein A4C66_13095 [Nitrospira sp. HN-bin3]|jgi:hypothetical protein|uniref:hypothetical protein n=1 Tax=Nitrospira cf. moscoviensis SBR1015 TaxID=96242 RepID=UPI000A0AD165|nr:hypothetical protein [Nitrospira cf. moscoviensis SBR1015]OQW34350.1 MAG: hypothetical protein A4C66_13095 [Nitrospira sp. HN-bin3]